LSVRSRPVMYGDPLAIIEEYEPGEGTYVDERGVIRAAVVGVAEFDTASKRVRVRPAASPRAPRPGASVIGIVTQIRHDLVIVDIVGEVSLRGVPRFLYEYSSVFPGAIPISSIADEYVKEITDYYRIGDVVLARVVSRTAPFHLTTVEPVYGVLYARCARCGALLEPVNNKTMKCPRCGHVEKRKVSSLAMSKLLKIDVKYSLVRSLS